MAPLGKSPETSMVSPAYSSPSLSSAEQLAEYETAELKSVEPSQQVCQLPPSTKSQPQSPSTRVAPPEPSVEGKAGSPQAAFKSRRVSHTPGIDRVEAAIQRAFSWVDHLGRMRHPIAQSKFDILGELNP